MRRESKWLVLKFEVPPKIQIDGVFIVRCWTLESACVGTVSPQAPSLIVDPGTPDQFDTPIGGLQCPCQLQRPCPVGAAQVVGENVSWPFSRSSCTIGKPQPRHPIILFRRIYIISLLQQLPQANATPLAALGPFSLCFLPIDLFCIDFPTLPLLSLSNPPESAKSVSGPQPTTPRAPT